MINFLLVVIVIFIICIVLLEKEQSKLKKDIKKLKRQKLYKNDIRKNKRVIEHMEAYLILNTDYIPMEKTKKEVISLYYGGTGHIIEHYSQYQRKYNELQREAKSIESIKEMYKKEEE